MLLTVALLVASSFFTHRAESADQSSHYEWAFGHYDEALEAVLSIPADRIRPFPRDSEWLATIRIEPAFEREILISLRKAHGGEVAGHYLAVDEPLMVQLERRRGEHVDWSLQQVVDSISTSRGQLSDKCPRLLGLSQKLARIDAPVVTGAELFADATHYSLVVETASSRTTYSLVGPGTAANGPHPLVTWAERMRRELEDCLSTPQVHSR